MTIKVHSPERGAPSLEDKRFGWQVSEGIANLRLECLKLALVHYTPLTGNENPIALAKRMSDFVIDGTLNPVKELHPFKEPTP